MKLKFELLVFLFFGESIDIKNEIQVRILSMTEFGGIKIQNCMT